MKKNKEVCGAWRSGGNCGFKWFTQGPGVSHAGDFTPNHVCSPEEMESREAGLYGDIVVATLVQFNLLITEVQDM